MRPVTASLGYLATSPHLFIEKCADLPCVFPMRTTSPLLAVSPTSPSTSHSQRRHRLKCQDTHLVGKAQGTFSSGEDRRNKTGLLEHRQTLRRDTRSTSAQAAALRRQPRPASRMGFCSGFLTPTFCIPSLKRTNCEAKVNSI